MLTPFDDKIATLRNAIVEAETAWIAAAVSIETAHEAAKKAYETCANVRSFWKREEGDELCDLAVLATKIAARACSRANEVVQRNSYDPAEIKRMLATEPILGTVLINY